MSKHPNVPTPFQKLFPSVIRGNGPRLLLALSACALLLFVGGGSYLLSRTTPAPKPAQTAKAPLDSSAGAPPTAQVLGTATNTPSTDSVTVTNSGASTSTVTVSGASTTPAPTDPTNAPGCTTACSAASAASSALLQPVAQTVHNTVQPVLNLPQQVLAGLGL